MVSCISKSARWLICLAVFLPVVSLASKLSSEEQNTIAIFNRVSPTVVNVNRVALVRDNNFDIYKIHAGMGSGFIWDKQGHVITNYHVVRNTREITVSLRNGKTAKAKIVGVAPRKDIAVLQLTDTKQLSRLPKLAPIPIADSSQLKVGQSALAIGNPYGLDHTVTRGIISAVGRRVPGLGGMMMYNLIQTDASINPGNSGGPLLNSEGALIGMNTMIVSNSGASAGIGFAVPSNTIKRIVDQIIAYGHVIQPWLGVYILDDRVAAQFQAKGAVIAEVVHGSPAQKAGLKGTMRLRNGNVKLGDAIIAIDGHAIHNYDDLYNTLSQKNIGQKIEVKFLRNGKIKTAQVKIEQRDS